MSNPAYDAHIDSSIEEMIWKPSKDSIAQSNVGAALRDRGMDSYAQLYRWSINDPEAFWGYVVKVLGIRFAEPPRCTLELRDGPTAPIWLPGARLNIAESCFQADADAPAIIRGDPDGSLNTISYGEVRRQADRIVHGLLRLGLRSGDPVAVFMPMTAASVPIYLGIILAGCVVVSIADSFSAEQVRIRLRISEARALLTVSHVCRGHKTLPVYDRAVEAEAPRTVVLDEDAQTSVALRPGDLGWSDFVGDEEIAEPVRTAPDAAINILFSSGTTGEPKAILWDHTTPIKAVADGHFHHDIHSGDVVAWPTNLGWMMGPWLVFATMINRGTIALFGDAPLDRAFGRFVQDARVNMLGVVPSLVRRWRETKGMDELDFSEIRAFSSTGECSNPDDMRWLSELAGGKPVIEYCGGTEIGGGYVTSTVVQPNVPSVFSTPALGSAFEILDDEGRPNDVGEVFLIPPAMGLSSRLLKGDHHQVYYADTPKGPDGQVLRRHGDRFVRLPNGAFRALGRADDTMNLGGIKVGAAEVERAVTGVGGAQEVAAIAVPPAGGGPSRLVICIGTAGCDSLDANALRGRMNEAIKSRLNPLFRVHDLYSVERLPRTASNKIMRRVLRDAYLRDRSAPEST